MRLIYWIVFLIVPLLYTCKNEIPIRASKESSQISRIFIDSYRQLAWLLKDTGVVGGSEFIRILIKNGFRPILSKAPLTDVLKIANTNDILFLTVSKYQTYQPKEIDGVFEFIYKGGNLLILGEHEDVYNVSSGLQNPMLEKFEIAFDWDAIEYEDNTWLEDSSKILGCEKFHFYASPTIEISNGKNTKIISDKFDIIAAYQKTGKILAVADSEFFFNGNNEYQQFGINHGGNACLVEKLFKWFGTNHLKQSPSNAPTEIIKQLKNFGNDSPLIWVYTGGIGGFIDSELDGFFQFFKYLNNKKINFKFTSKLDDVPDNADIMFLHNLYEPSSYQDRFNKIIVVGDSFSKLDDYTDSAMALRELGLKENSPPFFVKVLESRDLDFLPGTLMRVKPDTFLNEETSFNIELGDDKSILIKRSGLIRSLPTEEGLLISDQDTFYNPVAFGLDERVPWKEDMEKSYYKRKDVPIENIGHYNYQKNLSISTRPSSDVPEGPYWLVFNNQDTFVVTDADMISNYFLKKSPSNYQIADWMAQFILDITAN